MEQFNGILVHKSGSANKQHNNNKFIQEKYYLQDGYRTLLIYAKYTKK